MFWLFRRFCTLLGFLVFCLAVLYYGRNLVVEWTLCWVIPHSTTFECQIHQVEVASTWPLQIHLQGVQIENPPDFPERLALDIPQAFLELSPHFWHDNALDFRLIDLQISKFNVVNAETGENNLRRFTTVAQRNEYLPSGFNFELLQLRITDPRFAHTRRYPNIDSQKKLASAFTDILTNR